MYKVVVVEDESIVRQGIIRSTNWSALDCMVVGEADNGQSGLELIKRLNPDLVITDIEEGKECSLVLRPESAVIADEGQLPCKVILSCFMGSYQHYQAKVGDYTVSITDFNPKHKKIYKEGDDAYIKFNPCDIHVLGL